MASPMASFRMPSAHTPFREPLDDATVGGQNPRSRRVLNGAMSFLQKNYSRRYLPEPSVDDSISACSLAIRKLDLASAELESDSRLLREARIAFGAHEPAPEVAGAGSVSRSSAGYAALSEMGPAVGRLSAAPRCRTACWTPRVRGITPWKTGETELILAISRRLMHIIYSIERYPAIADCDGGVTGVQRFLSGTRSIDRATNEHT
jgi:hypothetical protein